MTKSPNMVICTDCAWTGTLQQCHWALNDKQPERAPVGWLVDLRMARCPQCHKLASLHVRIEQQQG